MFIQQLNFFKNQNTIFYDQAVQFEKFYEIFRKWYTFYILGDFGCVHLTYIQQCFSASHSANDLVVHCICIHVGDFIHL